MRLIKKAKQGFTLVELMIVVAIIGVLAALAIYGVRRYVYTSKTAEARTALGRIAKDASNAFNAEAMAGSVMALGTTTGISNQLCGTGNTKLPGNGAFVPGTLAEVSSKKYQSSPTDWQDSAGWECLKFSMQDPQYYRYNYASVGGGAANTDFTATAEGDLDGDNTASTFTMSGGIRDDNGELVVIVAPNIEETNPEE